MSSKSFQNVVGTLSLCQGIAVLTKEHFKDKDKNDRVMRLADRLHKTTAAALAAWPGGMTAEEIKRLCTKMGRAEIACFPGDDPREDAVSYSSMCLGLLESVLANVRDLRRRKHIEAVEQALTDLHKFFDKRLDSFDNYQRASNAVEIWNREMSIG